MKTLTLTPPWATLVALGHKHIETRSWSTSYRGPLAIHSAKAGPKNWTALKDPAFVDVLEPLVGLNSQGAANIGLLPRGQIIATCLLVDVVSTRDAAAALGLAVDHGDPDGRATRELLYGDYSPGRFAWLLECVAQLEEPIPARGMLSLWEPEPHPALELAEAQLLDVQATGGYRCHLCGCTDNLACDECCWWSSTSPPTCSTCADKLAPVEEVLA
jgi:hypothetical protein